MRKSYVLPLLLLSLLVALVGCAAEGAAGSASRDGKPHGECLVCKKNADLACVDIPIEESTPHVSYQGRDYYFCSRDCQKAFEKSPDRYVDAH